MNKIAFLNDSLRRTFARGKVVMTAGVAALAEEELTKVLERVRHFDEFTKDNDPHEEHDFGNFQLAGVTYFFKIDYYSPDMQGGSGDPADPDKTTRVWRGRALPRVPLARAAFAVSSPSGSRSPVA
jgi:Protein of unknown function (DUF3768)